MSVTAATVDPISQAALPRFTESEMAICRATEKIRDVASAAWARLPQEKRLKVLMSLYDMAEATDKAGGPDILSLTSSNHFICLRIMLRDQRWDRPSFLKYAHIADMARKIPLAVIPYLVLYFDPTTRAFSTETFVANYRAAHGR